MIDRSCPPPTKKIDIDMVQMKKIVIHYKILVMEDMWSQLLSKTTVYCTTFRLSATVKAKGTVSTPPNRYHNLEGKKPCIWLNCQKKFFLSKILIIAFTGFKNQGSLLLAETKYATATHLI